MFQNSIMCVRFLNQNMSARLRIFYSWDQKRPDDEESEYEEKVIREAITSQSLKIC